MTLENLYKAEFDKILSDYLANIDRQLVVFNTPAIPGDNDIRALLSMERLLSSNVTAIKRIQLPPLEFNPAGTVEAHFDAKEKQSNQERANIQLKADEEKKARIEEHENEKRAVNEHNASLIEPFKAKHKELLDYKEKLDYVFDRYDISPLDIDISDKLTPKEFGILIDKSLAVCDKYSVQKQSGLFDKIAKPLKGEKNLQFTLSYMALLLVCAYVLLPIASVLIFYAMCKSVHGLYRDIEALRIANALMAQIDYNRFVNNDDVKVVSELVTDDIDVKLQEELSNVKDYTKEKQEAVKELKNSSLEISKRINETKDVANKKIADKLKFVEESLAEVQSKIKKFMSSYNPFPYKCSNSVVMERKMILQKVEGKIDVQESVPAKNLAFISDREMAINGMKLFLCNMLLNVKAKQLTVDIIDPKNQGSDFTEFFRTSSSDFFRINQIELRKVVEESRAMSQANLIKLDGMTIDEFNKKAEETGVVPMPYRLIIVLSDFYEMVKLNKSADDEQQKNEIFLEYLRYSSSTGVSLWFLMPPNKVPEGMLSIGDKLLTRKESIVYNKDLGRKCADIFAKAVEDAKVDAVIYKSMFAATAIPRDKWFTFDTEAGIEMHFGLENGDPTKFRGLMIGDANVHALMGGTTGAGKSAAINQMICSLMTKYPPSELEIIFIDFKNVEAASLTAGYDKLNKRWLLGAEEDYLTRTNEYYSRFGAIPQMKIIAGTTDGEYALSIFTFILNEMARRQKIIDEAREKKIEDLRKSIRKEYDRQHGTKASWYDIRQDKEWYNENVYKKFNGHLPRLLIIFDEFQVMFNTEFVEQKIIDKINAQITAVAKLARAMGVHFWFTSQSMKGTMSTDTMAQFSMRAALRCNAEVSTQILGNPASGTITQKFGLIYTNDSGGENPKANKLWKVPFISTPVLKQYIREVNKLVEESGEKHLMADFYDEKTLVPYDVMKDWYTTNYESFKGEGDFILGERAGFSVNKAPATLSIFNGAGENILAAAFEQKDLMNLGLTLINNIKLKNNNTILIINSMDRDVHTLMDVESITDPRFVDLSTPDQDVKEFTDSIIGMIEKRQEAALDSYTPCYIVLIAWERAPGVGVDPKGMLPERFTKMLREGPLVNVHFILLCKELGQIPIGSLKFCEHRIAGMLTNITVADKVMGDSKVTKLPDSNAGKGTFAIYKFGNNQEKFKIYQHKFTRELAKRGVVIN